MKRLLGNIPGLFRGGNVSVVLAAYRPPNMGRDAVGGRVEPKSGLDTSPLSRRSRLKDASYLTSKDRC